MLYNIAFTYHGELCGAICMYNNDCSFAKPYHHTVHAMHNRMRIVDFYCICISLMYITFAHCLCMMFMSDVDVQCFMRYVLCVLFMCGVYTVCVCGIFICSMSMFMCCRRWIEET